MTIEDRQLDDWLRDVEVPADLKSQLLKLPNADEKSEIGRRDWKREWSAAGILVVAASLAGLILLDRWMNQPQPPVIADKPAMSSPTELPNDAVPTPPTNDLADSLESIRSEIDWIDVAIRERTIRKLNSKLQSLSKTTPTVSLDSNQLASMIVSMSDQSAIQWGASRDWVERDMNRVIERFPNTSGSKLAEQFLAQEMIQ